MAFQKFENPKSSFTVKASISPRGSIGLTNGTMIRFNLKNYKHAIMYYDKEESLIGIEFTNNTEDTGIVNLKFSNAGGLAIFVKAFLEYWNVVPKETTIYQIKQDSNKPNFLVIDLNTGKVRGSKSEVKNNEHIS